MKKENINKSFLNNTKQNISKKRVNLDNELIVVVRSNVAGKLIYEDHKTGDFYKWNEINEEQELTIENLKNMKSKYIKFFKENWISIVEVFGYEYGHISEIYDALNVSKYYSGIGIDFDIKRILSSDTNLLKKKLKEISQSTKVATIAIANEMIKNDELHDTRKIKAIEDVLGVELYGGR